MKISFVIGRIKGGGAERVVCNLANCFVELNCSVEIVTFHSGESYGLDERIKIYNLDKKQEINKFFSKIKKYFSLKKYMSHTSSDIIVAFLPVEICLCSHFRKCTNAKLVISERNDPSTYPRIIKRLLKYYAARVDGMVFQTEDAKSWYKDVKIKNTDVIQNPLPKGFVSRATVRRNQNGDIVGIGRLSEQKNWELLINAYSRLAPQYQRNNLVIYGEGEKKQELEMLCKMLKIENKVEFPGFVDNIQEVLENASMFILPSKYEGLPNALVEAMALGVPCIATDCPVGGPRSLIKSGVNGILINNNSVEQLSDSIQKFIENDSFADLCGKNALGISKRLDPVFIANKWLLFFKSVE